MRNDAEAICKQRHHSSGVPHPGWNPRYIAYMHHHKFLKKLRCMYGQLLKANPATQPTQAKSRQKYRDGTKLKTYTTVLINIWKRSLERMKTYSEEEIRELMSPVSPPTTLPQNRLRSAAYWLEHIRLDTPPDDIHYLQRFRERLNHQISLLRNKTHVRYRFIQGQIQDTYVSQREENFRQGKMRKVLPSVLRTVRPPGKLRRPLPLNCIKIDTASIALDPAEIYALMCDHFRKHFQESELTADIPIHNGTMLYSDICGDRQAFIDAHHAVTNVPKELLDILWEAIVLAVNSRPRAAVMG